MTDGLVVLYAFDAGGGDMVTDLADVPGEPAADLTLEGNFSWTPDGVTFVDGIALATDSTKLHNVFDGAAEITLEAWIVPAASVQRGPGRILTLSVSPSARTFLLGHGDAGVDAGLAARLRTTATEVNGLPTLLQLDGLPTEPAHAVYTHASDGNDALWVDGTVVLEDSRDGAIVVATDESFAVGNEITGDRPWRGTVLLAAVYDRALSADEINQNLDAGP